MSQLKIALAKRERDRERAKFTSKIKDLKDFKFFFNRPIASCEP